MNVITGLIIGIGWLIVGVVTLTRGGHWSMIVFDFVLGVVFLALAVRRAIRDASGEDGQNNGRK